MYGSCLKYNPPQLTAEKLSAFGAAKYMLHLVEQQHPLATLRKIVDAYAKQLEMSSFLQYDGDIE